MHYDMLFFEMNQKLQPIFCGMLYLMLPDTDVYLMLIYLT